MKNAHPITKILRTGVTNYPIKNVSNHLYWERERGILFPLSFWVHRIHVRRLLGVGWFMQMYCSKPNSLFQHLSVFPRWLAFVLLAIKTLKRAPVLSSTPSNDNGGFRIVICSKSPGTSPRTLLFPRFPPIIHPIHVTSTHSPIVNTC
jgi:hypothetical protein